MSDQPFNFLKSFCRLMEVTEVPPRFQIWTGIACLLSVLERRVYIPQGVFNVYPNYFMILIAGSGQKKSTPIGLADKLLRRVVPGINIVAQKVSPEALIKSIKIQTANGSTKAVGREACGGLVIADELATFLDRGALEHGLGPILTKLYDCSPFEYETIKHGKEVIRGGYLSILGGTTVELLRNSLPKDAIGGGFTSRTMFVYEDQLAPPVPWVEYNEELMELEQKCVDYLAEIQTLEGSITFSPEARLFYDADYTQRYHNSDFRRNGSLQGYENRRHTHLFKVAIAMMISESPSKVLTVRHLTAAKKILEEAEEYLPHVMELIIASEIGAQANQLYAFIKAAGKAGVPRSDLVRRFGSRMDAKEISSVIETLYQANRVTMDTARGGKLVYRAN